MSITNSITKQEQQLQLEALLAGKPNPIKNESTDCKELSKALESTGSVIF